MRKIIVVMLCACMLLTGCGTKYKEAKDVSKSVSGGYFTVIKKWEDTKIDSTYHYQIVYANDTKVKYLICSQVHGVAITPLYNADGSLQVYEEK